MSSAPIDTDRLAEYLKDLGNPLRWQIVNALSRRALSVTALTDHLNADRGETKIARSTVSCAVSILYKEGIIKRDQLWRTHTYSTNIDLLRDISATFQTLVYNT